jgi:hypothetical protein
MPIIKLAKLPKISALWIAAELPLTKLDGTWLLRATG